jgi:hypothetical protein
VAQQGVAQANRRPEVFLVLETQSQTRHEPGAPGIAQPSVGAAAQGDFRVQVFDDCQERGGAQFGVEVVQLTGRTMPEPAPERGGIQQSGNFFDARCVDFG